MPAVSRQCQPLAVTRPVVYAPKKRPQEEGGELGCILLSLLGEEYARHPFYGSRRMAKCLCGCGHAANRKRVRRTVQELGLAGMAPTPASRIRNIRFTRTCPGAQAPSAPTRCGAPTSPTSGCCTALSTWSPLSTGTAARCWGGGCRTRWMPGPVWIAWRKPSRATDCRKSSILAKARSSPALASLGVPRNGIAIGMDGRGRALDNTFVERLWRTVKYEDVYLQKYATMPDLLPGPTDYFQFYNAERLHQSLGHTTPNKAYQATTGGGAKIVDKFSGPQKASSSTEGLGQRHPAIMWTGPYLKLGGYLSGQGATLPPALPVVRQVLLFVDSLYQIMLQRQPRLF